MLGVSDSALVIQFERRCRGRVHARKKIAIAETICDHVQSALTYIAR